MDVAMEEEMEEGIWQLLHVTRVPYMEPLDGALQAATTYLPLYALHKPLRRQISNYQSSLFSMSRTTRWVVISRHQNRTLSRLGARCGRGWMQFQSVWSTAQVKIEIDDLELWTICPSHLYTNAQSISGTK